MFVVVGENSRSSKTGFDVSRLLPIFVAQHFFDVRDGCDGAKEETGVVNIDIGH